MPHDYKQRLGPGDLQDVLAFLGLASRCGKVTSIASSVQIPGPPPPLAVAGEYLQPDW